MAKLLPLRPPGTGWPSGVGGRANQGPGQVELERAWRGWAALIRAVPGGAGPSRVGSGRVRPAGPGRAGTGRAGPNGAGPLAGSGRDERR